MKNNKICIAIVMYRPIEMVPPVMSLLITLQKMGETIHFITTEATTAREFCKKHNIPATYLPHPQSVYASHETMNAPLNKIRRALGFIPQRVRVLNALRKLKKQYGDVIVWGQEMSSTAIVGNLGMKLFPKQVTTLFELYDNYGSNWVGFDINRAYNQSVLVHCEPNRARLHSEHHNLSKPTFVISNKPVMHPRKRLQSVASDIQAVFDKIGDRPIFLYQGIWGKDRQDVATIMETIAKHRPNYAVLSMPATDEVKAKLAPYPNAFTLPRIPAPHHLDITSHAAVGVAVYKKPEPPKTLNDFNEYYCAPNKIYEYAGFGVPTLGNKIPGLQLTVESAGAGICIDINEESILSAADELVADLPRYREAANKFFDDTDIEAQVKAVIDHVLNA